MSAAMRVTPFGFDRVFHINTPEPVEDARVEEGVAQIAELRAALGQMTELHAIELRHARKEAFEAGFSQAGSQRDAALLAAVDALHDALDDIEERLEAAADAMKADAADVAMIAAEVLAGHAVAAAPALAIDEALGRVLRQVARGTQLDIGVHPDLLDAVNGCVEERKGQERRKLLISVIADETIMPGDARISWEEGGLRVDAAARHQAVLDELAPLLRTGAKEIAPARIA